MTNRSLLLIKKSELADHIARSEHSVLTHQVILRTYRLSSIH